MEICRTCFRETCNVKADAPTTTAVAWGHHVRTNSRAPSLWWQAMWIPSFSASHLSVLSVKSRVCLHSYLVPDLFAAPIFLLLGTARNQERKAADHNHNEADHKDNKSESPYPVAIDTGRHFLLGLAAASSKQPAASSSQMPRAVLQRA